jgi:hypothetical protein
MEDTPLIKQFLIVEGMERGTVFTIGWPMIYLKMSIPNSTDMLFSSPQIFSGVHVTLSFVLCVWFVDHCLSFFFWSLCCLSFDLQIPIALLISSNSSY